MNKTTPDDPSRWTCVRHGGAFKGADSRWLCHACAEEGILPCACGAKAYIFGEALAASISCRMCDQHLFDIGYNLNLIERWNRGERGNAAKLKHD